MVKARWLIKKGSQGDELWTAANPATGKREIVDPEGEFISGETIIRLYYSKRIDGYVTIPEDSLFKVAADGYTLETCWLRLSPNKFTTSKENVAPAANPEGAM